MRFNAWMGVLFGAPLAVLFVVAQDATAEDSNDPDLPANLSSAFDKAEYLQLRDQQMHGDDQPVRSDSWRYRPMELTGAFR